MCRGCENARKTAVDEHGRPKPDPSRPGCEHKADYVDYEVSQADGLRCFVKPSGTRSLGGRYRRPVNCPDGGKHAKIVLTPWPGGLNALKAANTAWHAAKLDLAKGVDPGAARLEARAAARTTAQNTFRHIADKWYKREGAKQRRGPKAYHDLKRLIFPVIGGRAVASLKPQADIAKLHEKISDENGAVMADQIMRLVVQIINRDAATSDDSTRKALPPKLWKNTPTKRDRILDDDEIRAIWKVTKTPAPHNAIVRLALLTSARRSELQFMEWMELDNDGKVWTLPKARNKAPKEEDRVDLVRPLSQLAQDILKTRPRVGRFVFSLDGGKTAIRDMARPKAALDLASGTAGWTLHDCRRTARTLLSRAKVDPDHAERCLGHRIGGVRGLYDKWEFFPEKKRAFTKLAALVGRIVKNPPEAEGAKTDVDQDAEQEAAKATALSSALRPDMVRSRQSYKHHWNDCRS
jgi:integrase